MYTTVYVEELDILITVKLHRANASMTVSLVYLAFGQVCKEVFVGSEFYKKNCLFMWYFSIFLLLKKEKQRPRFRPGQP